MDFLSLSQLLSQGRPTDWAVAREDQRLICWSELASRVASLQARLHHHGLGRWILCCENTVCFAVGLLALWQSGRTAVLPPSSQVGSLREVSGPLQGVISDLGLAVSDLPTLAPPSQAESIADFRRDPGRKLDGPLPLLEIFTSGSTGERKAIVKTLRQLEEEIAVLESLWGEGLQDAEVFSTVSHQHIYGLLFRLLWPLSAGRVFQSAAFLYPEELISRMLQQGHGYLVSTPAHLKRMRETVDWGNLGKVCRWIFSSGSPLDSQTADTVATAMGLPPCEIFGSTETGGVAWRQQTPGPWRLAWQPLPQVQLRLQDPEGVLSVQSPFVSLAAGETWSMMGDRATLLDDGRFLLAGRADRIVKIEEKRLSLPDMEAHLREHPWVQEAGVVLLDPRHLTGGQTGVGPLTQVGEAQQSALPADQQTFRLHLGAVLVLNEAGKLNLHGRKQIAQEMRSHLSAFFDPILLPRLWRWVEKLPEDAQGKVTSPGLRSLFETPAQPVYDPEILAEDRRAGNWRLKVPEQLAYLEGHFPGFPLVPGIVQIHWVLQFARELMGQLPVVQRLEAIKFHEFLLPQQVFSLEVKSAGDKIYFSLWEGEKQFSSGRLILQ